MTNPFFEPSPDHGLPEFGCIEPRHYLEAFDRGIEEQAAEVRAIVAQPAAADFRNTVEALERSGDLLQRVLMLFSNLTSSSTNEELQALELDLWPRSAAHEAAIFTNQDLFARVRAVRESDETLGPEQRRLLDETYRRFVRSGAALTPGQRDEVASIDGDLAGLCAKFGQNVLNDTNDFEMLLESAEEIAGLPDFVLEAAAAAAHERGHPGKYLFTTSRSSITPFLQYAQRRDLRERIYSAYTKMGCSRPDRENHELAARISALRHRRAELLGFTNHAEFQLDDRMAGTPGAVTRLLDRVWSLASERVAEEAGELLRMARAEGANHDLAPWDWWYYTEKVRAARFAMREADIKPYFRLENVRDGAFEVVRRLYGIRFERTDDVPIYHPDVESYWVREEDGSLIGLFLADYFMRRNKRGGAWMNSFRVQSNLDRPEYPVVVNCCNFQKGDPCLLGADEVRTLFHEFGHALHGLLSRVTYRSLSGTSVKQDFVELPSQIMEHWAVEPEVMKTYARHVETGEAIPDEAIAKIRAALMFNQGFQTTEYLAASYLDMAWHTRGPTEAREVESFERGAMAEIGLIPLVDPRYKSSYFQHIFGGDHYSAGYYCYLWAEVLDADAYEAFREKGLFDSGTAASFRRNVLERGGTADPMALYRAFRGRDPDVEPLLRNRGLTA